MWEQKMPHARGPDRDPAWQTPGARTETKAASKTTTEQQLRIGSKVRAVGLKGAPELNGRIGLVKAVDGATGRYIVRFCGEKNLKKLRANNLELID